MVVIGYLVWGCFVCLAFGCEDFGFFGLRRLLSCLRWTKRGRECVF